jgi:hypothetical protein
MTKEEVRAAIVEEIPGASNGRHLDCLRFDLFCDEMVDRQFGPKETTDAWLWFCSGWSSGVETYND